MADEATTHAETYQRHGEPDASKWQPSEAVTGRPADPPPPNSTLADRAKGTPSVKQVDAEQVEDKAVKPAKRTRKAAAPKG